MGRYNLHHGNYMCKLKLFLFSNKSISAYFTSPKKLYFKTIDFIKVKSYEIKIKDINPM